MPRPKIIGDEELLDRLLEAFADLGYEGTSVRSLCRHLDISHNLIHSRYQSKDGAWYAAVDHGFAQLFEMLTMTPEETPEDTLELLRVAMSKYVHATIRRPALARVIQQESARPGARFDYMMRRYISPTRELTGALLTELQADGVVRPGAVETIYFFLITFGVGGLASATAELRGHAADDHQLADLAIDVIIDGLRAPPAQ